MLERLLKYSVIFLLLAGLACAGNQRVRYVHQTAQSEQWRYTGTYEIDPPIEYHHWWEELGMCMDDGVDVEMKDIRFMVKTDKYLYRRVLGRVTDNDGGIFDLRPSAQMRAQQRGFGKLEPTIWLAAPYSMDELLVKHEMAHVKIGQGGHPNPPFGTCVVAPRSDTVTWEPPRL